MHPANVDFVPHHTVPGGGGKSVMIIVPAFAEGQQCDPPVVAGIIGGFKTARTPQVRGRINEPCAMETCANAQRASPKQHRPTANQEQDYAGKGEWEPVPGGEPAVNRIAEQVRSKMAHRCGIAVLTVSGKDPAHMRPPCAVTGRVRVTRFVRFLVMDAVRGNPENGTALECHGSTKGEKVFKPLWHHVGAVSMQAVVAQPDAPTDGAIIHNGSRDQGSLGDIEKGRDGPNMQGTKDDDVHPIRLRVLKINLLNAIAHVVLSVSVL